MKNFLKISLLTAIVFTSFDVFAKDDNFSLTVNNENEKSIVFFLNEAQNINLSIFTSENELVYEQKIKSVGAAKKIYNLDAFPDGNYTLALETPLKLTTYKIAIEDGKALISTPTIKELFKPVLTQEKETISLSLKNQAIGKGDVEVIVMNEYNDQMYSKTYTKADFALKFDITKTDAKELIFLVKYQGEEYIETFKIR